MSGTEFVSSFCSKNQMYFFFPEQITLNRIISNCKHLVQMIYLIAGLLSTNSMTPTARHTGPRDLIKMNNLLSSSSSSSSSEEELWNTTN